MAPTADDHSAEEWLLLCDALALVVERCKSQVAAERLLLEFARNGRFPKYRFHLSDLRDRAVLDPSDTRGIDPRIWGVSSDVVRIVVDWATSSVSYLRIEPDPRNVSHHEYVSEVLQQYLREYLPAEPLFRIHHVRLHRDDVLRALASVFGPPTVTAPALPPAPTTPAPAPTPAPEAPKVWLARMLKDNPPKPGDQPLEYAEELYGLAPANVKRRWEFDTLCRRLREARRQEAGGKIRQQERQERQKR